MCAVVKADGYGHGAVAVAQAAAARGDIAAWTPGFVAAAGTAARRADERVGVHVKRRTTDRGIEPALSLESYVASVKRFDPGESAGYGRRWRARERTWLGVVPIGYGDGWRRSLSNNGDVLVRGRRRPLVGMVSMDNITVDLGPEPDVRPREPAVLIGRQGDQRILCEDVARRLGTINYEVTCGFTQRVPRLYRMG